MLASLAFGGGLNRPQVTFGPAWQSTRRVRSRTAVRPLAPVKLFIFQRVIILALPAGAAPPTAPAAPAWPGVRLRHAEI